MFSLFSAKTLPEQGVLDQKPWIKGMGLCDRARLLVRCDLRLLLI
jgi:hypothetical protein